MIKPKDILARETHSLYRKGHDFLDRLYVG